MGRITELRLGNYLDVVKGGAAYGPGQVRQDLDGAAASQKHTAITCTVRVRVGSTRVGSTGCEGGRGARVCAKAVTHTTCMASPAAAPPLHAPVAGPVPVPDKIHADGAPHDGAAVVADLPSQRTAKAGSVGGDGRQGSLLPFTSGGPWRRPRASGCRCPLPQAPRTGWGAQAWGP
jgi:hypothetical protein